MPTDADRYAQLLQNFALDIGATREAIELAFGVTLPPRRWRERPIGLRVSGGQMQGLRCARAHGS
jgi:hypothetical protein